jgi:hypothetical protein
VDNGRSRKCLSATSRIATCALTKSVPGWRVRCHLYWYNLWVGCFWDRRKQILYFCPLPMVCIEINLGEVGS